jgi:hypothetical protein
LFSLQIAEVADADEHRASVHSQNSFEAAEIVEEEDTVKCPGYI